MNAEIFYLIDQKSTILKLQDLLRKHVHSTFATTLQEVDLSQKDGPQIGWRYVKLLQASIPPEKGIKLSVRELGIFGYSFYIQVYYPFSYYVGKEFQVGQLSHFFPAVAVQDHMVLVPKGLGKVLEYGDSVLSPLNPINMGGVEEVDFQDASALILALKHIRNLLHEDLSRELRAYASFYRFREIDFTKLAQDLGIDLGFIQHFAEAGIIERTFYKAIVCEFDQQKIRPNRWTKVNLVIQNNSNVALSNIAVEIAGPAKIRPTTIRTDLPAGSTRLVPIAIMPEDRGDFPLEIVFVLPEDKIFSDWLPVHYIWLQCEP